MENLFDKWKTKIPKYSEEFKDTLFKSLSEKFGAEGDKKLSLGKHFSTKKWSFWRYVTYNTKNISRLDNPNIFNTKQNGYTEITMEEFKKYILKEEVKKNYEILSFISIADIFGEEKSLFDN